MAQTRQLQRRVRSVRNAKQLTKALEVVAASRMRRVVGRVEGVRSYGEMAAAVMTRIGANPEIKNHPYFSGNPAKPTLYIVFSTDRGQAGALNSNVFNLALSEMKAEKLRPKVVVFGRKGARFFSHLEGVDFLSAYEDIQDVPDANVFASVMSLVEDNMTKREIGRVVIIYTSFVSSLAQSTSMIHFLPAQTADPSADSSSEPRKVYEFEPDIEVVLSEAIKIYIEARLMQAKVESAASEHAMRMMAMGNANRNASDLIDSLTLELNASRQAAITQEIAEITGGAAAIAA